MVDALACAAGQNLVAAAALPEHGNAPLLRLGGQAKPSQAKPSQAVPRRWRNLDSMTPVNAQKALGAHTITPSGRQRDDGKFDISDFCHWPCAGQPQDGAW
jgi:hypothetical protein